MKEKLLPALFAVVLLESSTHGAILTVGHSANYNYQTITAAMAAATTGDEIRVADGTYSASDPTYPETPPINMKAGVTLIRNSPDIVPIIDAQHLASVIRCEYFPAGSESRIEGFQIRNGDAEETGEFQFIGGGVAIHDAILTMVSCEIFQNSAYDDGGGISATSNSRLKLIDCVIRENQSGYGGGMYVTNSDLTMIRCSVASNHGSTGGGIFSSLSSLRLTQCEIVNNSATNGGGVCHVSEFGDETTLDRCTIANNSSEAAGGGVYFRDNASPPPSIHNCRFDHNSAGTHGGGIYVVDTELHLLFSSFVTNTATTGGGIFGDSASLVIIGGQFIGNDGGSGGGGIYGTGAEMLIYSCLYTGNTVCEFGGGISAIESHTDITTCTFDTNHASDGGGAISQSSGSLSVDNSILWNNDIDELFVFSGSPLVRHSDVQGGYFGEGNIDADPMYMEGYKSFYLLSQIAAGQSTDSPCVDAGSDSSEHTTIYMDGEAYPLSMATTRTDRVHDAGLADMGYHLFQNPTECDATGCTIIMPSTNFGPGDECWCDVVVCNSALDTMLDMPVFVILEVAGFYLFAPDFDDFSYYQIDVLPGVQFLHIIPRFSWPSGAGSASEVHFYAGMTDESMTELVGEFDMVTFGWHP